MAALVKISGTLPSSNLYDIGFPKWHTPETAHTSFVGFQYIIESFKSIRSSATMPEQTISATTNVPGSSFEQDPETRRPLMEESSVPELDTKLRAELERYFTFYRRDLWYRKWTKTYWTDYYMATTSNPCTLLPLNIDEKLLKQFCNKLTTFYWAPSSQPQQRCPLLAFASIYKEWFLCHDDRPNYEFGTFFANPIQITCNVPALIPVILKMHKSLSHEAASKYKTLCLDRAGGDNPDPWLLPQDYRLLPLRRAILVVWDTGFDGNSLPNCLDENGGICVQDVSHNQSVLLVLTGDDGGLSAPIRFDSIRAQSMPLARTDVEDGIEAIRVSIATAVGFIVDLQRREEKVFPNLVLKSMEKGLSPDFGEESRTPQEYADRILQLVHAKGIDAVPDAKDAMERINAAERGDDPSTYKLIPQWFNSGFKCWVGPCTRHRQPEEP